MLFCFPTSISCKTQLITPKIKGQIMRLNYIQKPCSFTSICQCKIILAKDCGKTDNDKRNCREQQHLLIILDRYLNNFNPAKFILPLLHWYLHMTQIQWDKSISLLSKGQRSWTSPRHNLQLGHVSYSRPSSFECWIIQHSSWGQILVPARKTCIQEWKAWTDEEWTVVRAS